MATTQPEVRGFASPFEVPVPEGCEGWESMYPYYALFSEERRASEEARGWFRDGMHFPEPMFRSTSSPPTHRTCASAGQYADLRGPPRPRDRPWVLYGWVYMSANAVTDEAEIGRRAQLFGERAGFYFQNWDDLYGRWLAKVQETIGEIAALEVPDLPEIEDNAVVTEGPRIGSAHTLLVAYDRLLESVDRIWQDHFEFLNLGYAAYLVFYELCKQSFPDIPDQDDREDGQRDRRCPVPPRERARPPRRAGGGAGRRGRDQGRPLGGCAPRRARCQRPGSGVAGRLGSGQDSVVLLLQRQRLLPPSPLVDRRPRGSAGTPGDYIERLKPARTSAARWQR